MEVDMHLLDTALQIATATHAGQTDKAGRPYILHPLRVMAAMDTDEERAVALLHDVIEGGDVDVPALLAAGVPEPIADAVARLSKRAGVLLRGPRGVTPAEIQAWLAPYALEFDRLVDGCRFLGDDDSHPGDSLDLDMEDPANWERAIDWMHDRAHASLGAATQLYDASAVTGMHASESDR
jgi:hypothetical protein